LSPAQALNHKFIADALLDDKRARETLLAVAAGRKTGSVEVVLERSEDFCTRHKGDLFIAKLQRAKQAEVASLLGELLQNITAGRHLLKELSFIVRNPKGDRAAEAGATLKTLAPIVRLMEQQLAEGLADDIDGVSEVVRAESNQIRKRLGLTERTPRELSPVAEALERARMFCERHADVGRRISRALSSIEAERLKAADVHEGKVKAAEKLQPLMKKVVEESVRAAKLLDELDEMAKRPANAARRDELEGAFKLVLRVKQLLDNAAG
jgi:hypothetical protein